jgi:hypothetical protein
MFSKRFLEIADIYIRKKTEKTDLFKELSREEFALITTFKFETVSEERFCGFCTRKAHQYDVQRCCGFPSMSSYQTHCKRFKIIMESLRNACTISLYTVWFLKPILGRDMAIYIGQKVWNTRKDYCLWYIPKPTIVISKPIKRKNKKKLVIVWNY